jgi:hypothetical protein
MNATGEGPPPLQVFEDPHNDPDCIPKVDDSMWALQDPGETSRPKKHGTKLGGGTYAGSTAASTNSDVVIVYPKLMKALALIQRTLQAKYSTLEYRSTQQIARSNVLLPAYILGRRIETKHRYLKSSKRMLKRVLTHYL